MTDDPRCCGSGTCIIDNEGRCWCGQQWDGHRMCQAPLRSGVRPAGEGSAPGAVTAATTAAPTAARQSARDGA